MSIPEYFPEVTNIFKDNLLIMHFTLYLHIHAYLIMISYSTLSKKWELFSPKYQRLQYRREIVMQL